MKGEGVLPVKVPGGSVTLYSSRLWHNGGANNHPERERIFAFLTVAEPETPAPPGLIHTMSKDDVGSWLVSQGGVVRRAGVTDLQRQRLGVEDDEGVFARLLLVGLRVVGHETAHLRHVAARGGEEEGHTGWWWQGKGGKGRRRARGNVRRLHVQDAGRA